MVLVGHKYNPKTDNPIYWFIDLDKQVMVKHYIPKSDSDSCFKQKGLTEAEIRNTIEAKGGRDIIKGIDWITQYDLLSKKEVTVARVRFKSAKLVGKYRLETSNEANIKREYRHSFDKTWLYGLNYDSKFKRIITPINTKYEKILRDHDKLIRDRMLQWTFTPLPKIKRMALDIETLSHGKVKPDVKEAPEPVISCAFAYSDNQPGEVVVLSASARGLKYKAKSMPMLTEWIKGGLLKVIIVNSEHELLEHVFQRIRRPGYPLISTFYGLGFDMPYLRNRALALGFPEHEIPIKGYLPKFSRHEWTIEIENKIHLDLNVHLNLAVIKNYVHRNKYLETSLDKVSQALIDMRKYESDTPISEMPLSELVWYNFWDAYLTQRLTEFNNEIVLKIIFLFMRIGRQSFKDAAHRAISSKIINLLYGYMIESNILIPTREELKVFGSVESESRTGKSFEGAKILSTIMGVYIGTDVVDFSSLYPSQNQNYNISFETMNCGHEECKNAIHNQIPGLDHYSCIKYKGIMTKLVGLIKDIRVKIFKPLAKDPEMSAIEQALKVYTVSAFGVTGDKKFSLYCPPAGESTTALGRYALDRLQEKAESYPGVTVIFGDTDSVGLVGATPEIIKELEEWSQRVLNIELAHEYHALIFVIAASKSKKDEGLKKNYFYVEEGTYKVVVKGLAGKKRQTPPIISQCFWNCLNSIADALKDLGDDIHSLPKEVIVAGAREIVIQIMRDYWVRIWNRKGTIKDYRYSVQKTKTFAEYTASTPQHIKAALALAEWMKSTAGAAYRHVPPEVLVPYGSYIEFVKTAASDKRKNPKDLKSVKKHGIKINPMPIEMATIEDVCPEIYHSSLLSTMEQIMIPLGISEEDVVIHMNDPLSGQTALDQFT